MTAAPSDIDRPADQANDSSDLGIALQAYALTQLRRIDDQLKRHKHPHRAIHETRKAIRRCRAALRLCDSPAHKRLRKAEQSIRGVGKQLSTLRDAHVLTETAASIRPQRALADPWRAWQTLLRQRRDTLLAERLADDPAFGTLRRKAGHVLETLNETSFDAVDGETVVLALRHSASRMREAERDASASSRITVQHRWRRRIRRLRLQLECLQDIVDDEHAAPAARVQARWALAEALETMPPAPPLTALTDRLGKKQDLAHMKSVLRRQAGLPRRDDLLAALK